MNWQWTVKHLKYCCYNRVTVNFVLALNLSPVNFKKRNKAVEWPDMSKNVLYFNQKWLVYVLIPGGISPSSEHCSGMLLQLKGETEKCDFSGWGKFHFTERQEENVVMKQSHKMLFKLMSVVMID